MSPFLLPCYPQSLSTLHLLNHFLHYVFEMMDFLLRILEYYGLFFTSDFDSCPVNVFLLVFQLYLSFSCLQSN